MKRSNARAAVALSAVLLLAAGCGSSSKKSSSATTVAAPKGTPIKLHSILTLSAATGVTNYVELESALKGLTAVYNSRGGMNGHPVQLTICDDASDVNKATACARAAVADNAAAVIGGSTRNEAQLASILGQAGIPIVGYQVNTSTLFTDPISYPVSGGLIQLFGGAVLGMKQQGLKSAGAWNTDVPQAKPVVDYIAKAVQDAGMKWVGNVPQTPGAADFAPFAAAMAEKKPEAGIVVGSGATAVGLALAAQQTGATYKLVGTDLTKADLARLGSIADNYLAFGFFPPLDDTSAGMQRCMKDLDAGQKAGVKGLEPDVRKISLTPTPCAVFYILEQVTKGISGDITSQNLRAALDSAQNVDTGGIIPPWTPGKQWSKTFPRISNPFVYLYAYKNGKTIRLTPTPLNPLAPAA